MQHVLVGVPVDAGLRARVASAYASQISDAMRPVTPSRR
jgi:hypothetical protein